MFGYKAVDSISIVVALAFSGLFLLLLEIEVAMATIIIAPLIRAAGAALGTLSYLLTDRVFNWPENRIG
ncbi:MAG: hypothetical protein R3D97_11300 [Paracoccaceae bacterium]